MSTPRNNIRKCISKLLVYQLGSGDFLKNFTPKCWDDCPKGFYDDLRDKVGDLTQNNTVPALLEGVDYALDKNPGSWHEATLMIFTILFGTENGRVEFKLLPIEATYCGWHKCHQCLDFYDSGGKPKWRCVLCQHFPAYGKDPRVCNGGPDAAPGLYGSGKAETKEPFCIKLKDDNKINSLFINNIPIAGFHRDTWANSFPCRYYERRSRASKQPAPLTAEEIRMNEWVKARFHAGVRITEFIESPDGRVPEREHLITTLSVRLPEIDREIIRDALDDAFEDILKIRGDLGNIEIEGAIA